MSDHYSTTPAAAVRQVMGVPEPDFEARFNAELPERRADARRFHAARGWIDDDGAIRPRTTMPDGQGGMVTVDLAETRAQSLANRYGVEWLTVSEGEEREIVRRLTALARANDVMAKAQETGPGTPSYQEAQRRFADAQMNQSGVLRGVPNA